MSYVTRPKKFTADGFKTRLLERRRLETTINFGDTMNAMAIMANRIEPENPAKFYFRIAGRGKHQEKMKSAITQLALTLALRRRARPKNVDEYLNQVE
ncbi:Hypothetical protein NTJ_10858 [Nesidiocoris tenuis]|uniref:Uncharacterized protein n=1 Tax=Nesidiocoris tenuis TaxID=355587 RepID=A0ABN7B1D1_9HEMI|nr:Hypothetical protein NTJ_10858 [Nesidiocoris tenuis]